MNRLSKKFWYLITQVLYRSSFNSIGKKTLIYKPLQLDFVKSILIESNVYIAEGAWLMGGNKNVTTLEIKHGTTIGHFCHIVATNSVTINENVLIADKVFISDCTHNYQNIKVPIMNQSISSLNPVIIGENSWLGENVCVLGATIGKHCIIGSNSVVNSDIPDYCVAAGIPARVVKRYNFQTANWDRVCD